MLVFRKILRTYETDDPIVTSGNMYYLINTINLNSFFLIKITYRQQQSIEIQINMINKHGASK